MTAIVALDQGTTSSRAVVFAHDGEVLGQAQHEFTQHFPQPGWVEHDAEEIVATQLQALREAWSAAGKPAVDAVGVTNQRETVVVFERKSGKPVHRAIVWQDRRTADVLRGMADSAAAITASTGLPLDPYFSAAKIAWILDHVDGARAAAERGELAAATIDAWLIHKLTGGAMFATEPSNASRTSLFDLHTGDWSDELLAQFRVPRAMLPEIRDSAGDFGRCDPRVAPAPWPIRGVLGDQQAALFGHGALAVGDAKCTYGTGAFLLCNAGNAPPKPRDGLLATVAWRLGGQTTYALEGSVLVAGAAVQWLRDGLGIVDRAADVEALARQVDDTGGLVFVPAFTGLGTPDWDPDARGLLIGLTRGTTRAHIARAVLEAMALQVYDVQRAVEGVLGRSMTALRVDGGAAAADLLMEIQATLSQLVVQRPAQLETTALGAWRIARLGVLGGSLGELPRVPPPAGEFRPDPSIIDATSAYRRWREAVTRCRGWAQL